jgi:hypothetical protein
MEPATKLKLVIIQSTSGIYISDNVLGDNYFTSKLQGYKFDGTDAEKTYVKDWFKINAIPIKIERNLPEKRINIRYELKEGYPESELTPKVINVSYIDEDDQYYRVVLLYDVKYDLEPSRYENVEFEIILLDADANFKPVATQYAINSNFMDKLTVHPILLPMLPCSLSVDQTYKIIREYVKAHVDLEWAKITSDYDFCFTVKKLVYLDEPESYSVDVANINNWGSRKRKSRLETRYRKYREVEIFQMAPKPYQNYTVIKPFSGDNYADMIEKINKYLGNLITEINEPLVDCPHCHGTGVTLNNKKGE